MLKSIIKLIVIFCIFLFITGVCAYLTITYSIKNEDIIVVPELVGKGVVDALEQLSDLGLNTKVKGSEYTTGTPKNHIITQDPEPGTLIKEGRDVKIIFSKGPKALSMPGLTKLLYQEAGLVLDDSGLQEGALSYTYNDEIKKNAVISQYPLPGADITHGTKVNLLISKGKRLSEYMMSDLTGRSIDDAIFIIEKNNLALGEIKSVYTEKALENTVTSQNPRAGYRVMEGNKVNLVINRASNQSAKKYIHDAGSRLFRYQVDNGFLKKQIKAQISCYGRIDEVFNKSVKPGEEVWVLVPYNTEATVFLYENNKLIKTQYYN